MFAAVICHNLCVMLTILFTVPRDTKTLQHIHAHARTDTYKGRWANAHVIETNTFEILYVNRHRSSM